MTPEIEQWRPVVGYEGLYEVSDQGNVRSVDRAFVDGMGRTRRLRGRPLRAHINASNGRRMLQLKAPGRERLMTTIYPLVLEAFVGPRPPGMDACHNDGDRLNDRLENLRWDTSSENGRDTVRHGKHPWARRTHCSSGHVLAHPNLDPALLPRRKCRACARAQANESYARSVGRDVPDLRRLADWHYGRIMTGA